MTREITPNRKAFLDMLAFSELGQTLLDDPRTDRGYKVIVGSTPLKPILMDNYLDHPRKLVILNDSGLKSTAAGRYQLLARYFDPYKKICGLYDFGPDAQDQIALQQIAERGALEEIDAGYFQKAVAEVSNIWASLPGAGYHQHENLMGALEAAYERAGGAFA